MRNIFLIFVLCLLFSCTEQKMAREYGGSMKIELPRGERLIEATWKDCNLWYLTEQMDSDYVPRKLYFRESSSYMFCEGEVIFVERR